MAEDQTLEETLPEETSEETAQEKETPEEKTTEPDYKVKFRESQREAIRLAKELKGLKAKPSEEKSEEVESETGETLDQIVEKKVQEKIAPLTKQQQEEAVDRWLDRNPDAVDYLQYIEDSYQSMPGKSVSEKLENAFLVAKKDAMKTAGKKEMAFALYQKEQAVVGGGGASGSAGESLPELTAEEKKVAQAMGIGEEAYAKRKLEKK